MGKDILKALANGLQAAGTLGVGLSAQARAEANAKIDRQDAARTIEEARRRAHQISAR